MEIGRKHPVSIREGREAFFSPSGPAAFQLEDKVKTSVLARAAPHQPRPPVIVSPDKDTVAAAYREQSGRGVTHVAVVRRGYEHTIQQLGDREVLKRGEFTSNQQSFILNLVENLDNAEAAFNAWDDLSPYAASPVAMVFDNNGSVATKWPEFFDWHSLPADWNEANRGPLKSSERHHYDGGALRQKGNQREEDRSKMSQEINQLLNRHPG